MSLGKPVHSSAPQLTSGNAGQNACFREEKATAAVQWTIAINAKCPLHSPWSLCPLLSPLYLARENWVGRRREGKEMQES